MCVKGTGAVSSSEHGPQTGVRFAWRETRHVAAASEEAQVLDRLIRWAAGQELVRALVLQSSRAVAQATLDALSDYDMLVVVSDLRPFVDDKSWLHSFGTPLVLFGDAEHVWGNEACT